jgi:hypothetical protein
MSTSILLFFLLLPLMGTCQLHLHFPWLCLCIHNHLQPTSNKDMENACQHFSHVYCSCRAEDLKIHTNFMCLDLGKINAARLIDCRKIDQLQRDLRNENGKMDVAHEASDSELWSQASDCYRHMRVWLRSAWKLCKGLLRRCKNIHEEGSKDSEGSTSRKATGMIPSRFANCSIMPSSTKMPHHTSSQMFCRRRSHPGAAFWPGVLSQVHRRS